MAPAQPPKSVAQTYKVSSPGRQTTWQTEGVRNWVARLERDQNRSDPRCEPHVASAGVLLYTPSKGRLSTVSTMACTGGTSLDSNSVSRGQAASVQLPLGGARNLSSEFSNAKIRPTLPDSDVDCKEAAMGRSLLHAAFQGDDIYRRYGPVRLSSQPPLASSAPFPFLWVVHPAQRRLQAHEADTIEHANSLNNLY
eukprot:TRINITY_DN12751_c1_g1_i1.p1 TRINITY_DN12751_c1_g1~~TRINITY_DN12751_c1_g1_i1.p1  ORF type:complete len:203 (-),score=18.56 TRINITY_DN12751_c1_g1_i1:171-758(-)